MLLHQLLLLEQLQRVADRLPRHPERTAEFFLADALSGGECAVGDRRDQPLVSPVDQRRLRIKRLQPLTILNSEFHNVGPIGVSKGSIACARTIRRSQKHAGCNGCFRRTLAVAARSGDGPFTSGLPTFAIARCKPVVTVSPVTENHDAAPSCNR